MKGKNKYAKYAMILSALAFAFGIFLSSYLALIFAPLAIVFGIIALKKFNADKGIGGKGISIASLIVGIVVVLNFVTGFIFSSLAMQGSSMLPDTCINVYSHQECINYSLNKEGILTFSYEHDKDYPIAIEGLTLFSQRDSRDCNNDLISVNGNTTFPYTVAPHSIVELKINCGPSALQKDKMVGIVNLAYISLEDNQPYAIKSFGTKFRVITSPSG